MHQVSVFKCRCFRHGKNTHWEISCVCVCVQWRRPTFRLFHYSEKRSCVQLLLTKLPGLMKLLLSL